jgi:hypothetical protein
MNRMLVSAVEVVDAPSAQTYTLGAMPSGWRRARAVPTILAIVGLLLLGAVTSASAHVRPVSPAEAAGALVDIPEPAMAPPPVRPDAPAPPASATLVLTVVLTLVLGLSVVTPRRTLVVALVLVAGVLTVESGVHSVHHLADRQAAADCAVASATAHVHGATPLAAPDVTWVPTPIGLAPLLAVEHHGRRPSRPDAGRAPPAA